MYNGLMKALKIIFLSLSGIFLTGLGFNVLLNLSLPIYLERTLSTPTTTVKLLSSQVNLLTPSIKLKGLKLSSRGSQNTTYHLGVDTIYLPFRWRGLNHIEITSTAYAQNFDFYKNYHDEATKEDFETTAPAIQIQPASTKAHLLKQYKQLYSKVESSMIDLASLFANPIKVIHQIHNSKKRFHITIPHLRLIHKDSSIGSFQNCSTRPQKNFPCIINVNTSLADKNVQLKSRIVSHNSEVSLETSLLWSPAVNTFRVNSNSWDFMAKDVNIKASALLSKRQPSTLDIALLAKKTLIEGQDSSHRIADISLYLSSKDLARFDLKVQGSLDQELKGYLKQKWKSFLKKRLKQ